MNKKGFTLVELIGVLVIIGLLLLVTATPILGQIRNQKGKLDDASTKVLYSSATTYLDEHISNYPKKNGMTYYLSVTQLIEDGYLKDNYLETTKVLSESSMVIVNIVNGSYSFEVENSFENISDIFNNIKTNDMYSYYGGKYLKGEVTNNYVLYSGLVWRIMGKNYDGSIRLIADDPVTTLFFANGNTTINKFQETYAYEWLNNYFISRLNYNDTIVRIEWCDDKASSTSSAVDSCKDKNKDVMTQAKVGLLSLDEYNLSKDSSNKTYIKSNISFTTLTQNSTNSYYNISKNSIVATARNSMLYIKPVINVKPTTAITDGNGSSTNPYVMNKSVEVPDMEVRTLSDINLASGDYIKLGTLLYRVVESDKSSVKLIKDGFVSTTATAFGTSAYFKTNAGIGLYLNDTLFNGTTYNGYKKLIKSSMWYQGDFGETSYKYTSLSKSNFIEGSKEGVPVDVKVGLPKVGEILTIPSSDEKEYWTMSLASSTNVYSLLPTSVSNKATTSTFYVKDVIIIDSNSSVVKSGIGTGTNPYDIKSE